MLQLGGHRKCCGVKYSTGVGVRQAFMYAQMFLLSYEGITTNWRLHFLWTGNGSFRVARLPREATRVVHTVSSWVEKNPVPAPNHRALDWSVVLTVGRLCPIVPQDNIVASNKHNWPEFTRACLCYVDRCWQRFLWQHFLQLPCSVHLCICTVHRSQL